MKSFKWMQILKGDKDKGIWNYQSTLLIRMLLFGWVMMLGDFKHNVKEHGFQILIAAAIDLVISCPFRWP